MRALKGIILISASAALLGIGQNAMACSTEGWLGGASGIPANGDAGSPPAVSRYSEFCALAVTSQAHVQDNSASDTRYRGRFYVLDKLNGTDPIDIFVAYSDEGATTTLFKVAFNGSQFTFNATGAGGESDSAAAAAGKVWNLVEFDWDSGSNTFSYWVNADATTAPATNSVNAGTGTVEAVRLGAPAGFTGQSGSLTFDAFESHRTTPVGALKAGDANKDGNVNTGDIGTVITELFNGGLATGQPDCNGDGNVNTGDIGCIITALFSS